jgi:hypothetical protein
VAGAKDRLIAIRATLNDAIATETIDLIASELGNLDEVMKSLGVAEGALKKQQQVSSAEWNYDGWAFGSQSRNPYVDDQGFDWGGDGFATPKTTSGQRRTPKPERPR